MTHAENRNDSRSKRQSADESSDTEARHVPIGDGEPVSVSGDAANEANGEAVAQQDPIQALEAKVVELEDQRLRALADFDNFRKRMIRQLDEVVRSANDRLLSELLDVADNFERAIEHTNDQTEVDAARLAALKQGTELIYGQLRGLLERYNVKPFEALGHPFDPRHHEALAHIDSEEHDDGIVAAEINRGYMIGERVLRHARVAVSKGSSEKRSENRDPNREDHSD